MDSESREEAISRALASGGTVIIGHLQAVEATLLKKLSDLLHCYHINTPIGMRLLVQALLADIYPTKVHDTTPCQTLWAEHIHPGCVCVTGCGTGKCIPTYLHEKPPYPPPTLVHPRTISTYVTISPHIVNLISHLTPLQACRSLLFFPVKA